MSGFCGDCVGAKRLRAVVLASPPPHLPSMSPSTDSTCFTVTDAWIGGHGWVAGICQPWERILGTS